jgi:hypothetical protein
MNSTENPRDAGILQAIKAMAKPPAKKYVPRGLILNKKIKRVKFTEHIIIMSEFRN